MGPLSRGHRENHHRGIWQFWPEYLPLDLSLLYSSNHGAPISLRYAQLTTDLNKLADSTTSFNRTSSRWPLESSSSATLALLRMCPSSVTCLSQAPSTYDTTHKLVITRNPSTRFSSRTEVTFPCLLAFSHKFVSYLELMYAIVTENKSTLLGDAKSMRTLIYRKMIDSFAC